MIKIRFYPIGGLANRMRAIASIYSVCQQLDCELTLLWIKDNTLNADFSYIFQAIESIKIKKYKPLVHSIKVWELFGYKLLSDNEVKWLTLNDILKKVYPKTIIKAYHPFANFKEYTSIFQPAQAIQKEIDSIIQKYFTNHTIGLHIRRTDNIKSIEKSPIDLFIKTIRKELEINKDSKFYLATDSDEIREQLENLFDDKIITGYNSIKGRDSFEGIKQAVIDLFCLAATNKIYGSYFSSFSEMAALIGKRPLEILTI